MAQRQPLGGNGRLMVGDDATISLEVLTRGGSPVDVDGWTTVLVISSQVTTAALVTASGTVTGVYNGSREANTQRVAFSLSDDDTITLLDGNYQYSIRRTDSGSEKLLSYGPCYVERANQT